MATTTNYGWTTPDDTGLVKDGASAIRTLGTSVDTTTKNLNPSTTLGDIEYRSSTANTNTRVGIGSSGQGLQVVAGVPSWAASSTSTLTTTGDTLYASAANTLARRAIGSTGDVLTVAGGVPTWAAPSAGANWSLLNTGGTSLTAAATITVSGISGKDKIMVLIDGADAPASSNLTMRFNTDSGANYSNWGQRLETSATYNVSIFATTSGTGSTSIFLGTLSSNNASTASGYVLMSGANASGAKIYNAVLGAASAAGNANQSCTFGGYYLGTSTISSVSILSDGGNFTGGKIYVYTSA